MSDPRPALTDRIALTRQRRRAQRDGMVDLFHQIAADEIHDRLAEVNRTFTAPALVTGFPDIWGPRFPDARVVARRPGAGPGTRRA